MFGANALHVFFVFLYLMSYVSHRGSGSAARACAQTASVSPQGTPYVSRPAVCVHPAVLTRAGCPLARCPEAGAAREPGNRKLGWGSRTGNAGTPARGRRHQGDPPPIGRPVPRGRGRERAGKATGRSPGEQDGRSHREPANQRCVPWARGRGGVVASATGSRRQVFRRLRGSWASSWLGRVPVRPPRVQGQGHGRAAAPPGVRGPLAA